MFFAILDESWTEESTEEFERLTHCAQWMPLMARALKYCGQIPCLELIDTTGQSVRRAVALCTVSLGDV